MGKGVGYRGESGRGDRLRDNLDGAPEGSRRAVGGAGTGGDLIILPGVLGDSGLA